MIPAWGVVARVISLPGVNILQNLGKLFPDENAKKGLTLPHLLSKFQESWELFPDIYKGI